MSRTNCPVCGRQPNPPKSELERHWYTCMACERVFCTNCGSPGFCSRCSSQLDASQRQHVRTRGYRAFHLNKARTPLVVVGIVVLMFGLLLFLVYWK
ncbi:MAG: hypothetical protein Q6353_011455, partial [Candidatus Sigynarchaeum springense]